MLEAVYSSARTCMVSGGVGDPPRAIDDGAAEAVRMVTDGLELLQQESTNSSKKASSRVATVFDSMTVRRTRFRSARMVRKLLVNWSA